MLAYATSDGSVRAVGAQTGLPEWRAKNTGSVWTAGSDFLVADTPAPDAADQAYRELDHSGHELWNASLPQSSGATTISDGYAFRQVIGDGAYISSDQCVLRLGKRGGFLSRIPDAWRIIDVRPPLVVSASEPIEPTEDHMITFDADVATLADGSVRAAYHFAPDYDANLIIFNPNDSPGFHEPIVRIVGDTVFAELLSQRIYRYRLADPKTQRPLLIASHAQLLGGPYRGWIYVARQDGVWMLRPETARIRTRFVVRSHSTPVHLWTAGNDFYVVLTDGHVVGVNATTGQRSFSARPCATSAVPSGLATTNDRVFVVCVAPSRTMRLFAFARRNQ